MRDLKNRTVLIFGNGPSLSDFDFSIAKAFKTIGVNAIQMIYEPDYVVFVDDVAEKKHKDLYKNGKSKIYCPDELNPDFTCTRFKRYRWKSGDIVFTDDILGGVYYGHSSVIAAMHLAYLHDASSMVLAGVDLNNGAHFYSDKNKDKEFTNIEFVIKDFEAAASFLKNKGISVFNVNPESALECFQKINLNDFVIKEC